jgi:hypothetical protein
MRRYIAVRGPILPGSVSTVRSRCGKPKCACKGNPPRLHGDYHRWTGFIGGKRTTKTLSRKEAAECERRIRNYRRLQRQLERLVREAIARAPWVSDVSTRRKGGKRSGGYD